MSALSKRILGAPALAVLCLATAASAHAASRAQILETHPSRVSTLGAGESFWVHIEYTTDEPISLWARPYRNGVRIDNALSNASLTYSGAGTALGWFALNEPGEVDEIRISAGGGKPYREWELSRHPVELRWTTSPSSDAPRPVWVDEALATEKVRYQEDAQRRAAEPTSGGDVAFFSGFMLIILVLLIAGLLVPLWTMWKWRGSWRIAAAVPVCVLGFVVLRILIDTARDPTSHNLWPFEILMFGSAALVGIGALKIIRRVVGAEG